MFKYLWVVSAVALCVMGIAGVLTTGMLVGAAANIADSAWLAWLAAYCGAAALVFVALAFKLAADDERLVDPYDDEGEEAAVRR